MWRLDSTSKGESVKLAIIERVVGSHVRGDVHSYMIGEDSADLSHIRNSVLDDLEGDIDYTFREYADEFHAALKPLRNATFIGEEDLIQLIAKAFSKVLAAHYSLKELESRFNGRLTGDIGYVAVNRTLGYVKHHDKKNISLWVPSIFSDDPFLIKLFVEGLRDMAALLEEDPLLRSVEVVHIGTWLAQNAQLAKRLGFPRDASGAVEEEVTRDEFIRRVRKIRT